MAVTFGKDLNSKFSFTYNGKTHKALVVGMSGLTAADFKPQDKAYGLGHGGTYSNSNLFDAEKSYYNKNDDNLCWAATCANMLAFGGWGKLVFTTNSVNPEDPIFNYYKSSFIDARYWNADGLGWIFGEHEQSYYSYLKNTTNGNLFGLMPEAYHAGRMNTSVPLEDLLKKNQCVGISYYTNAAGTSGHGVTVFGCTVDSSKSAKDHGYYTGLFITDSDDNKEYDLNGKPDRDDLRYVPLVWNADCNTYALQEYYYDKSNVRGQLGLIYRVDSIANYKQHTANIARNVTIKKEYVFNGSQSVYGRASSIYLMRKGNQTVHSGGSVAYCKIGSGATQTISSGGRVYSAVINSGGEQYVCSGGIASIISISKGGLQYVHNGGSSVYVTVSSGGSQIAESRAYLLNCAVQPGGSQIIRSGGSTSSSIISSDGQQIVSSGAVVTNTGIEYGGTQRVDFGGVASATTISSGGLQSICYGGNDYYTSILARATQNVNGTATYTAISGNQYLNLYGMAISATIHTSGVQYVLATGTASNTVINSGGSQEIYSGAYACSAIISAGGSQNISGGGSASCTTIHSGGTQNIKYGAYDYHASNLSGCCQNISGLSLYASIRGTQNIHKYGSSVSANIFAGGIQNVSGRASNSVISSGGSQYVSSGGVTIFASVLSGGSAVVAGSAARMQFASKSVLNAKAGAKLANISLAKGASLIVASAVFLSGTNTFSGISGQGSANASLTLASKSLLNLSGTNKLNNINLNTRGATVKIAGTGNNVASLGTNSATALDFDLSKVAAGSSSALLAARKNQTTKCGLSISISGRQQKGQYVLGKNLGLANNTVFSIKSGRAFLGSAKVNGASLLKNGILYSLSGINNQVNLAMQLETASLLRGTGRSETLTGSTSCEIFYGGKGNDIIRGNGGRDVVVYDRNDWGKDTISKTTGSLTIIFNGLTARDVSIKEKGGTMAINRKGGQSITVQGWNRATHRIIYGGTLRQFSKYVAASKPTTAQQTAARNEIWKKAGILA